jgi:hypothetical protein
MIICIDLLIIVCNMGKLFLFLLININKLIYTFVSKLIGNICRKKWKVRQQVVCYFVGIL